MGKYTWYVFTVKDTDGGLYAFCERIRNNNNLVNFAREVETMNACDSKAQENIIAKAWNETFIRNGTANKWIMPKGETA